MIPGRITHIAAAGRPRIRLVGSSQNVVTFGTSCGVSQPSGARAGDLGISMHSASAGMPAGWTDISSFTAAPTSYRVYDGTEGSITITRGSNGALINMLAVFRGVHQTSPFDVTGTPRGITSGTSFPSNAVTAVTAETLHLSICTEYTTSGASVLTAPSGWNLIRQGSPATISYGMAYVAGPAAGAAVTAPNWTGSIATYQTSVISLLLRSATT